MAILALGPSGELPLDHLEGLRVDDEHGPKPLFSMLIAIKKEVVDPEDVEMLQDLILTATNEALRKVDAATQASFGKYNIPGLM